MNLQNNGKYKNNSPFGRYNERKDYFHEQSKYFDKPIKEIRFVHDYSVKNDRLEFTNFLERKNSRRNTVIKEVVSNCIKDYIFFKKHFYGREISQKTVADVEKKKRLHEIIALYDGFQANDDMLFKYKPNKLYKKEYGEEGGLQFVFEHKNGIIYVYLIDLYHLAIPSGENKNKERFIRSDEYNRRKRFSKDIKEIIFEKEKIPS